MYRKTLSLLIILLVCSLCRAQSIPMQNLSARRVRTIAGVWQWSKDTDQSPLSPTATLDNVSFPMNQTTYAPADWNFSIPDLQSFQGKIWFKKDFDYKTSKGKLQYLHFAGNGGSTTVWLNGVKLGTHSQSLTPFEFDITSSLHNGANTLVVCVDNTPATSDRTLPWFNYGGIVRPVSIIETPETYIRDYSISLGEDGLNRLKERPISLDIRLNRKVSGKTIRFEIPEVNYIRQFKTDKEGRVEFTIYAGVELWTTENPKLYKVKMTMDGETLTETMGFRKLSADGGKILLNDEEIFLCGVNIVEETAFTNHMVSSRDEAVTLMKWVREMGFNFIRLAHHPQSYDFVSIADEMGILVWEELPVPQNTVWSDPEQLKIAKSTLESLLARDRNRCSAAIWSLGESSGDDPARAEFLRDLHAYIKAVDPSRLTSAYVTPKDQNAGSYARDVDDPAFRIVDIITFSQNEPDAGSIAWNLPDSKPVVMAGFDSESVYSDTVQGNGILSEQKSADQIEAQLRSGRTIKNLAGTVISYLKDYRSADMSSADLIRSGLFSDQGDRKKSSKVVFQWNTRHKRSRE